MVWKSSLCCLTFAAVAGLGGCGPMARTGPEQHTALSVDLDKSEKVRVELEMSAGELDARGGGSKLMDGDFTYNVEGWKPDLHYSSSNGLGELRLEQHGPTSTNGDSKNHWDLQFNDGVPIDFRAKFGAGEGRLKLGSLNLNNVEIEMGAGSLRLDLRGAPKKDYEVRVRGGVGEAIVYLPKDVGISASATGGIGEVSASGLRKSGDTWVNDAYDKAGVKIRLDIKGGVGSIRLIAE